MFRKLLLAATILAAPSVANAKWLRAESEHFIVLSDATEPEIRKQTEQLEKFVDVVSLLTQRKVMDTPEKLTIYNVATVNDMLNTMPYPAYGVGAYYSPHLRGSYLVTPKRLYSDGQMLNTRRAIVSQSSANADDVFFHELSHHLMFQNAAYAYPAWYSEGFAEYYGTIDISDDDKVQIGAPQHGRIETYRGNWVPMKKLLAQRDYADAGEDILSLYAEGWLLIHYCANNKDRGAQMRKYLTDINANVSYAKAAEAFGDLGKLDAELKAYGGKSIPILTFNFKKGVLVPGPVAIRDMTAAEVALWRHDIKISGGLPQSQAKSFVGEARRAAAASPKDPFGLRLLTETEWFAGNTAEANAAMTRWIAVAPNDPRALMYRGKLASEAAKAAKKPANDPAWAAARADIKAAMKLAPRDPRVLEAYYATYTDAGVLAPFDAQNGLMEALKIVPQDDDLRKEVAADFEARGMFDEAITIIRPAAVQIKPENEKSSRDKSREARRKKLLNGEYAMVRVDPDEETARDMYDRLLKKAGKTDPNATVTATK